MPGELALLYLLLIFGQTGLSKQGWLVGLDFNGPVTIIKVM